MVPGVIDLHLWCKRDQVFSLRPEAVLNAVVKILNVRLRIKSGQSAEVVAPVAVIEEVVELAPEPLQCNLCRWPGLVIPRGQERGIHRVDRRTHDTLEARHPVIVESEPSVDTSNPIEVRTKFAVGEKNSDCRLGAD